MPPERAGDAGASRSPSSPPPSRWQLRSTFQRQWPSSAGSSSAPSSPACCTCGPGSQAHSGAPPPSSPPHGHSASGFHHSLRTSRVARHHQCQRLTPGGRRCGQRDSRGCWAGTSRGSAAQQHSWSGQGARTTPALTRQPQSAHRISMRRTLEAAAVLRRENRVWKLSPKQQTMSRRNHQPGVGAAANGRSKAAF